MYLVIAAHAHPYTHASTRALAGLLGHDEPHHSGIPHAD